MFLSTLQLTALLLQRFRLLLHCYTLSCVIRRIHVCDMTEMMRLRMHELDAQGGHVGEEIRPYM